jgi:uncharacterized phage protein (TIGR01671 family)
MKIKFRAWDKELKKMFKVTCLDFSDWWVQCERPIDAPRENGNAFYGERNSFNNEETDRHILMQYTGSTDDKGIEIYDGDIVKCLGNEDDEYTSTVKYGDGAFGIDVNGCDYDFTAIGWAIDSSIEGIEVIGNIYE